MNSPRSNVAVQLIAFVIFTVVAFASYQKNYFGFSEAVFFESFDKSSESLVVGNIAADQLGLDKYGWDLGLVFADDDPLDTTISYKILDGNSFDGAIKFSPYVSQVGIQGLFFSEVYESLGKPNLEFLNSINSLLMAVVVALLTVLYINIYDKTFGVIFFATMISSPWMISFARNLYWVPVTWLLPAVFAALAYLSQSRVKKFFFLFCVLLSVAVKSLAGYEYLTTITIFACSVFLLAPMFNGDTRKIRPDINFAFFTFASCVIGFLVALIFHASKRGESIYAGISNIYETDVKRRTYGDPNQFDPVFRASLDSSFLDVLDIYWNEWQTTLAVFIPGDYLGEIFWLCLTGLVYVSLTRRNVGLKGSAMALVFFTASVSWFLFGKAHSYIHTQLNYVLWYFGFIQALLYCLVRFAAYMSVDVFRLGKKLGLKVSVVVSAFSIFIGLLAHANQIDKRMDAVISGVVGPIDIGASFEVYFRDDGNMVFYAPECRTIDLTGNFILHFIPERTGLPAASPHGFENRDFVWPDSQREINRNPLSDHFGSCYTEVSLPIYKFQKFRTGQYDIDSGSILIRWDVTTEVQPFTGLIELSPYNHTDSNWENGISLSGAGFFISNTVQNRMSLSDQDAIEFPFSGRRAITFVEHTDSYINVRLEGPKLNPILDGYPNRFIIRR